MQPAPETLATTPPTTGKPQLPDVETARAAMLAAIPAGTAPAIEVVPLDRALGRILAEDLVAGLTMPRWPNSAMDGFALRRAEVGAEQGLPVSQHVAAGTEPEPLQPGTAARIFTGAPVPPGADTVVMQEHCRTASGRVVIERLPEAGANVRGAGEDFRAGDVLLGAGTVLRAPHIGLAASAGCAAVPVRARPRVALVITGNELVPPGEPLTGGQIHESNGHLLCALVEQLGALPATVHAVADDREATETALRDAAAAADLVVTSGGVSVGEADHVRGALTSVGELALFGVAVKPGKPVAFGRVGATPLLALPGNPVSLFVTFALFGAPLLRRLQGRREIMPYPLCLPAGFEQTRTRPRADYLRARIDEGRLVPCGHQGSGILHSIATAEGLACVPPGTAVTPGDGLAWYPMESLLS